MTVGLTAAESRAAAACGAGSRTRVSAGAGEKKKVPDGERDLAKSRKLP